MTAERNAIRFTFKEIFQMATNHCTGAGETDNFHINFHSIIILEIPSYKIFKANNIANREKFWNFSIVF